MRHIFYYSVSQMHSIAGGRLLEHSRRTRPKVFYKKDVHKNFAKFTVKKLGQSLFLSKLQVEGLKERLRHKCFPVKFEKF